MRGVQWDKVKERLHKDGWLFLALAGAVAACLLLGAAENVPSGYSSEEVRLARVLSAMAGAGRVEVAVFYESSEEKGCPTGAVVVAQGAGDVDVRIRLTRAVATLTGLDAAKVEVFKLEEGT